MMKKKKGEMKEVATRKKKNSWRIHVWRFFKKKKLLINVWGFNMFFLLFDARQQRSPERTQDA